MTGTTAQTRRRPQWRLELAAQGPDRVADRAQARSPAAAPRCSAVAAATVWLFDLAQVIAH